MVHGVACSCMMMSCKVQEKDPGTLYICNICILTQLSNDSQLNSVLVFFCLSIGRLVLELESGHMC